jgi:uncharacterized membrane protein YfcA
MMDSITLGMLLLVICGGFLAAFVDSVVGGGGLIALPVLLMAGLPPHLALGTNKFAGTLSSFTSTVSFMRSGAINKPLVFRLLPFTVVGAALGTIVLQFVPSGSLKPLVVVLLIAVSVYTLLRRGWGDQTTFSKLTAKSTFYMMAAALLMGAYDGFFGPGTGSILIFIFLWLGFDFISAAGNAKVLNFGSNIASLIMFIVFRSVDYRYGLIMGAAMVAGSVIGSQVAIRQGARYVRPLFIGVSLLLVGKQLWDLLH